MLGQPGYWQSWYMSFLRVLGGFVAAMLIGIPFGLMLAVSRVVHGISFPVFEVLRPIPPLAWVPASIIFWPTQELAIIFITFLGAFFTIVINVIGGARSIDVRYFQAAQLDGLVAAGTSSGASSCPARCRRSWSARRSAWASPGRWWWPRR